MNNYDIVVVGGGPAGLAAAIEAKKNGVESILVVERDRELGGILNQCIHNGFGLHIFKEELTGPEYAERFINEFHKLGIEYKLDTMVLNIDENKTIKLINSEDGLVDIKAKAIILAMGCRERTRGAINIPGTRPSGIFSAGTAQRFVNMEGYMPGKKVVILGSGDIGLIMARTMVWEGARVSAVVELMPYSGGLTRNIVQCLDDFDIPLLLSHTIIDIIGNEKLESVVVSEVDVNRRPIKGTEKIFECDTLLLSVGLVPENELAINVGINLDNKTKGAIVNESMETSVPGIFACGNVLHVHDLVDWVTEESRKTGKSAARHVNKQLIEGGKIIETKAGDGINYIVPQKIRLDNIDETIDLYLRVDNIYENVKLVVRKDNEIIKKIKKSHLAPGEMESVSIKKENVLGDEPIILTIELEEEMGK
ncbi:MAG: NAD(P)/FAD-dependent oxidoreductase [Clostridiales bacterium]|nr:NAD(P)/FAD-dependent oxidoreductase [Clostridiales bacterium]